MGDGVMLGTDLSQKGTCGKHRVSPVLAFASLKCYSVAQDCSEDVPDSRGFLKLHVAIPQKEASARWPA